MKKEKFVKLSSGITGLAIGDTLGGNGSLMYKFNLH